MTECGSLTKRIAAEQVPEQDAIRNSMLTSSDVNMNDDNNLRGSVVTFHDANPGGGASTEGDSYPKRIVVETAPDGATLRNSVVTFSDSNTADVNNFRGGVVTFTGASPLDAARPFRSSSSSSTTRTVVVDATKHLEEGSTTSDKLVPGVDDVTKGVQDVVTSAKHFVRIFRIDNEIFEVNEEQLDRVRMMHDRFADGVQFSFNYNTLLLVASILAGLGLVSNSSATIIASMLVSPIMGPVIGLAYGTTICDWKMVKRSIRTECFSLIFCILVGAVIGAITGPTALADDWPTSEMSTRGQLDTFLVALPVAFFSGLGVAVSLLDEQTNSLVGVAISASLLPPAVNAGILWVAYVFVEGGVLTTPDQFDNINDEEEYDSGDYRGAGFFSLFVTLANILLIWISGMLMFRMKEVLPIKKKIFWEDITIARKIYQKRAVMLDIEGGASGSSL